MDEKDIEDEIEINLRSEPDAIFSILTGLYDPNTSDIDIITDESQDEGDDSSHEEDYNFLNEVGKFDLQVLKSKSQEQSRVVPRPTIIEPGMKIEHVSTPEKDRPSDLVACLGLESEPGPSTSLELGSDIGLSVFEPRPSSPEVISISEVGDISSIDQVIEPSFDEPELPVKVFQGTREDQISEPRPRSITIVVDVHPPPIGLQLDQVCPESSTRPNVNNSTKTKQISKPHRTKQLNPLDKNASSLDLDIQLQSTITPKAKGRPKPLKAEHKTTKPTTKKT